MYGQVEAPKLAGPIGPPSAQVTAPQIQMPADPQAAVSSLAQPLMRQFQQQTVPGILARSLFAGQGPTSTREQLGEREAITDLGQAIATGAVAPIYHEAINAAIEQARLGEAASAATAATGANIFGTQAVQNVGLQNAATNLFGTEAQQNSMLNQALAQMYGSAVSGAVGMGNVGANIYGTQAQQNTAMANAITNMFGTQANQNIGIGNMLANIFGKQAEQNIGLANVGANIFGTQAQQNVGLGRLGLDAVGQQLNAALAEPEINKSIMNSLQFLSGMGGLENALEQAPLTAAQQSFLSPINLQSQAAQALINSTLTGGGTVTGTSIGEQNAGTLGTISQIVGLLGSAAGIAGMIGMCWIAKAIYGEGSDEFFAARHYIFNVWRGRLAHFVRRLYLKVGPWIGARPSVARLFKPLFDIAVRRGKADLYDRWRAICSRL
jgi:hypothetical protein